MLYIDTEFNGTRGKLISMALVHPNGAQWYETLPLPEKVDPWVLQHVVPFINKVPIRKAEFQTSLLSFLTVISDMERLVIIADWPEDFIHFMEQTFQEGGQCWDLQYNCRLIKSGPLNSKIPHNALSDAIALMEWHQKELSNAQPNV